MLHLAMLVPGRASGGTVEKQPHRKQHLENSKQKFAAAPAANDVD
jgi:hypothetical protein